MMNVVHIIMIIIFVINHGVIDSST